MITDIELVQLRRFIAVVESGSFVEAARRLNITQQALSASIARLEDAAGVSFLNRRRGSAVELTAFGHLLLARARTQLVLSDRLMSEIGLLRHARGGTVSFGVGETMTGRRVATAVRRFHRERPDVQIRLIEAYTESFAERLLTGEIDFIIGSPSYRITDLDDLEFRELFQVQDVLAVRREHPLARLESVSLADLSHYSWIVPGFRGDVVRAIELAYCSENLPPPKAMIQSDSVALGTWLCMEDDFVAVAPPDMIGPLLHLGPLTVLDADKPTLLRSAGVIVRRHAQLSPPASHLLGEIVRECTGG